MLIGCIALAVVVVLTLTVLWLWWQNEVGRRLRAIRARGEPLTFCRTRGILSAPPAEEDATDLWLRGSEALEAYTSGRDLQKLPLFGNAPVPPCPGQRWAELELSRQFLAEGADAMCLLHDAGARGGRRAAFRASPRRWRQMERAWRPCKDFALVPRAWRSEAKVREHSGDASGAVNSIHAGLMLAQSLENAPTLVSQLVRIAMFGIAAHEAKTAYLLISLTTIYAASARLTVR